LVSSRRISLADSGISRTPPALFPLFAAQALFALVSVGAGGSEVGQREHRQGDVGIPRPPGPDLVVV
jgi:hypothetical protein